MSEREPFQRYLDRMAAAGFRPSSTLGQNFLLDPSLHRWIAECAAPTPADTVVEIGAGLGFLTRELVARAGRVIAVEIDPRLLALAREDLVGATNLEWIAGDALGGPGGTLSPTIGAMLARPLPAGGRRLLIANLPYAVSGPLLAEVVAADPPFDAAVLLVQKELAQRVVAAPGAEDHGGLSVGVQVMFVGKLLRDVPPQVFRPRPKVTSSILHLVRRPDAPPELAQAAARRSFLAFVRALFQQRRKVLRTTLPAAAAAIGRTAPVLDDAELGGRAEQASVASIVGWWRSCTPP
ncbi:MAG: ribosomal RNA small subunit methyltransferase A [Planctomycetes bacterium]|nr:ribosomal RNA small subunit methyltransferase A [Planctomycetota bacterium]